MSGAQCYEHEVKRNSYLDKDFLVTDCGVIFEVIGSSHSEEHVTAFPRYIPYEAVPIRQWDHTWRMLGRDYSRFDVRVTTTEEIKSTFESFFIAFSKYLSGRDEEFGLVRVPHSAILEHMRPPGSLARLRSLSAPDALQAAACRLAEECERIGIPAQRIGVSYSLMFDGHTLGFSDVDFVVYGADLYLRLLDHLRTTQPPMVQYPTLNDWEHRYESYGIKDMPLIPSVYALHKIRRCEEGFIDGHKLSIFAVRFDEPQTTPCKITPIGPLRIFGRVVDAGEGMFRPSIYKIEVNPAIQGSESSTTQVTIVNYRREYVSQARNGEWISAYGLASWTNKGEVVLELGSMELRGSDFLVVNNL